MSESIALMTPRNANATPEIADDETLWRAVLKRDGRFDGRIFFAVLSTGIYCRPSCPARRPRREQVIFFRVPEAAEHAGFRSCRRCRPRNAVTADPQVEMVRRACRFIEDHAGELPTLEDLSAHTGVSPYHFAARVQARSRNHTAPVRRSVSTFKVQDEREETRRIRDWSNVRCRVRFKQPFVRARARRAWNDARRLSPER